MGAFDKVCSGNESIDQALDYIRIGDNVVWQVSNLEEYKRFAVPFAKQSIADGRNLIYVRFAQHEPVLEEQEGLRVFTFDPDVGFEAFTVAIHDLITREGKEAFYVFDSLSELQSVWYTDLMMGNFFCVTCPYLFELDTVAFFPLIRGCHSFDAVAKIRDTTQLLLDVYSTEDSMFLHPLKVWNRYSDKMFMPYGADKTKMEFHVLNTGVAISRYYGMLEDQAPEEADLSLDSFDRFFARARQLSQSGSLPEDVRDTIIDSMLTKDARLKVLIQKYFKVTDYFRIRSRMIGSGAIGGKACGVLLSRRIVKSHLEEYRLLSEAHDSYYVGSDVFYTYIVFNKCWRLRIRQRTPEGFFSQAGALRDAMLSGSFPADIRERFRIMLEHFGQSPIIVRSSSFLEDGFGNAFAGKYESVFCVNQGSPAERLEAFEQAVRQVYASMMDESALEYRIRRGLDGKDEQMAVLVQRVSGTFHGNAFFPSAAGVGFSHSAYKWRPDMDPSAGMLRIVMGLGTKAVDRTENDYPRLVNLDSPSSTTHTSVAEKHKFSQRRVDVLDVSCNELVERKLEDLLPDMPDWYKKLVLERDYDAESRLAQMGRRREVWFVSCQKLLENQQFTDYMQRILKTLERVYENPVDIEYTINGDESGNFVVNLLQCRPLYVGSTGGKVQIPDSTQAKLLFDVRDAAMGSTSAEKIDVIVHVSPKEYYEFPHNQKHLAADVIGAINRHYGDGNRNLMLLTPGRIGTSSPELGVPVNFSQISGFKAICEVSDLNHGHIPDLSYGSHMFQDLVEAEMIYVAILNNQTTRIYAPELLEGRTNLLPQILPEYAAFSDMIQVYEVEEGRLWLDALSSHAAFALD